MPRASLKKSLTFTLLTTLLFIGYTRANEQMIDQANALKLTGEFSQGGMIVGNTLKNSKVLLNGQALKVSEQGEFAFGFSRDDKTEYTLTVTLPNKQTISRSFIPTVREYNIQRVNGIKKAIMKPNPEAVARAKKDNAQVKSAREVNSDLTYFAKPFIAPINGTITGVYGSQRYYNGEPKSPHYGLDYAGKVGDPVKAPASGIVTLWVPDMFYSGGTMIIDHGHGFNSTFLHLSDAYVQVGDKVKQGEVVAAVGKSGRATGPHLDWRVNWYDVRLDPALVLKIH